MISNAPPARLADCAAADLGFAGAESNVAISLARLGHSTDFVTALGDDPFGWRILKSLRAEGVRTDGVEIAVEAPTALMLRDRPAWGEPAVYYYRRPSAFGSRCSALAERIPLENADILFLTGITPALSAECRDAVEGLLDRADALGTQVWFDINFRGKLWSREEAGAFMRKHLDRFHGIFASVAEARLVFPEAGEQEIACRFFDGGTRELVLKAGSDGASYHSRERTLKHGPFHISAEIDPIGAGDAFNAGFLSARFDGLPIKDQLERGCALGALACLTRGDWEGAPTRPELERFIRRETASHR